MQSSGALQMLLFSKIWRTGVVTEVLEAGDPASAEVGHALEQRIKRLLGRALAIRHVDAGSCNGCEIEIAGLTNPIYDMERFGLHFVASPRHADLLMVTGPVTRNMEIPLRRTYEATPAPKFVVADGAIAPRGPCDHRNWCRRRERRGPCGSSDRSCHTPPV